MNYNFFFFLKSQLQNIPLRLEGDLIEEWKQNTGGQVFLNKIDLESWNPEDESEYALGLFSKSHLKYVDERNNKTTPDLELMITKALKKLKKNENGFFLMVEGGKIDKAHHESWAHRAFEETLELGLDLRKCLCLHFLYQLFIYFFQKKLFKLL